MPGMVRESFVASFICASARYLDPDLIGGPFENIGREHKGFDVERSDGCFHWRAMFS